MDPLPSINEVYSLLIQEERECSVKKNLDPHMESTTLVTKVSSSAGNNNNKNSKGKNDSICNHCGIMGHTVEKCYMIYGYPPSFKPKGKKSTVVHQVNLQDEQVEKNSTSASTSFSFTQEQCQQSLAMLGTQIQSVNFDFANNEVHMANNVTQPATHSTFMAGNFPFWQNCHSPYFSCELRHLICSEIVVNTCVMDARATNHNVRSITLLIIITFVKHYVEELPMVKWLW